MSREYPLVVYVGEEVRGQSLQAMAESRGWALRQPTELLEALGMYQFCYPDLYVLDDLPNSELAEQLYFHLRTVDPIPVLVLTEAPRLSYWEGAGIGREELFQRTLQGDEELVLAIEKLLRAAGEMQLA